MYHVENLKFDDPIKQEYRKQKKESTKHECRHLKGIEEVTMIDPVLDEAESYIMCSQCLKRLKAEDLEEREKHLINFNKNL